MGGRWERGQGGGFGGPALPSAYRPLTISLIVERQFRSHGQEEVSPMPLLQRIAAFVLGWAGFLVTTIPAGAALVPVATAAQLLAAVNNAQPGDVITLAPGTYDLSKPLYCDTLGTAAQPNT